MRYALYDSQDHLWLGNDTGPRVFSAGDVFNDKTLTDDEAYILARLAAEVLTYQMDWPPMRILVKPYDDGPLALRDELEKPHSGEDWLKKKMRGVIP